MNYVIHPDYSVTRAGREVGFMFTDEEGRAIVQFHDPADMPAKDEWFTSFGYEWA